MSTETPLLIAQSHVRRFTLLAMATGAVPVPSGSAAIVAENTVMLGLIGSAFGQSISPGKVVASLGTLGTVNLIGRTLFVEGARLLGWASGPLGLPAVCVLGAATAGLQTWMVGQLAIAICEGGGEALDANTSENVVRGAHLSFEAFRAQSSSERRSRGAQSTPS